MPELEASIAGLEKNREIAESDMFRVLTEAYEAEVQAARPRINELVANFRSNSETSFLQVPVTFRVHVSPVRPPDAKVAVALAYVCAVAGHMS